MTDVDRPTITLDGITFPPCGVCAWCTRPADLGPTVDRGSGPGLVHAPRDSCYARALRQAALDKAGLTNVADLWSPPKPTSA